MTEAKDLVAVPKGGGAQSGIGHSFAPNAFTGTANFSIPIDLPVGRRGLTPSLTLAYSSGQGNGPFGLGWALDVPAVARKVSKGVPRYTQDDVFVLSSAADDLVFLGEGPDQTRRYRPRIEGNFAEILHHRSPTENFWTLRTIDGHLSTYGGADSNATTRAPESDPLDRIFAWHLSETVDPFGNRVRYDYRRETTLVDGQTGTRTYLDAVHYVDTPEVPDRPFLLSVRFDYGTEPRPDAFSAGNAGFDLRTDRRCRGLDVVLNGADGGPIRRYDLTYLDELVATGERHESDLPRNGVSLLARVRVTGRAGPGHGADMPLPALDLDYSGFRPERRRFSQVTGASLPSASLASSDLDLMDLNGNGLPDFFETRGVPRYWENLGGGHFAEPRRMDRAPSGLVLSAPGVSVLDIDGDGRSEVMIATEGATGYYRLGHDGQFDQEGFVPLPTRPSFDLGAPGVARLDLDGDGRTDAVMSREDMICIYADPQTGWDRVERHPKGAIGGFPDVNFDDLWVRTADMSGDGLSDIVMVHDRTVEYWPNFGHGRWGRRRVMWNAPPLPQDYLPHQVVLGDVDGDGQADLIFFGPDRVFVCFNQSGNRWSDPFEIEGTPLPGPLTDIRVVDLLGSGTAGVLWSEAARNSGADFWFLDLTGGHKPYLLNRIDNNTGAQTTITYRSSCEDYLRDRGHLSSRWRTTLPMPVQVVGEISVADHFSGNRLITSFAYRHGHFDGAEQEYVGFGRVDRYDTELQQGSIVMDSPLSGSLDAATARPPPTRLTQWFDLGPIGPGSGDWEGFDASEEYWAEDPPGFPQLRADRQAALAGLVHRRARRDAMRAMRGTPLRDELYSLDGSDLEARPYLVSETVRTVRPVEDRPDVHFAFDLASRETRWERGTDPLTTLVAWGDHDAVGQPRRKVDIGCPRGWTGFADSTEGYLARLGVTRYAEPAPGGPRLLNRRADLREFELDGPPRTAEALIADAMAGQDGQKLIGHARSYYDGPAFEGLPLGQLGPFGAETRTEQLALTPELITAALNGMPHDALPPFLDPDAPVLWPAPYPAAFRDATDDLAFYWAESGPDGPLLWVQQSRTAHDFQDGEAVVRGLPRRSMDPAGQITQVDHDEPGLFALRITGPTGLVTTLEHDYHAMQIARSEDPNGASTSYRYTPLGLLSAVIRRGRDGEGDNETSHSERYVYDLTAFEQSPAEARRPISAMAILREHHAAGPVATGGDANRELQTVAYSDGFGRLLQSRAQAEDESLATDLFGEDIGLPEAPPGAVPPPPGPASITLHADRVRVSGVMRYDSKGRPVEQFEPYFGQGLDWQPAGPEQIRHRVQLYYDAAGRMVRQRAADGAESWSLPGVPPALDQPAEFTPTPWETTRYDPCDLAPISVSPLDGTLLGDAAAPEHAFTPEVTRIDAFGRVVHSLRITGPTPAERLETVTDYDIRGNVVSITDPMQRAAFRYHYDLLGRAMRSDSLDAGEALLLCDAAGRPVESQDAIGGRRLYNYDALSRPLTVWARDRSGLPMAAREHLIWGDAAPGLTPDEARGRYLLGRPFQHYDGAGRVTAELCDFRGNVTESLRQVLSDVHLETLMATPLEDIQIGWPEAVGPALEAAAAERLSPEPYRTSSAHDAMDRPIRVDHPEDVTGQRHRTEPRYAASGALAGLMLDGSAVIERLTYDASGRRRAIQYGNGVLTRQTYDPRSGRLRRMCSQRISVGGAVLTPVGDPLQDVSFTHDLAGNLVSLSDVTPQSGFPGNPDAAAITDPALAQRLVAGDALIRRFTYDAFYRLVSATGREQDQPASDRPWDETPRDTDFSLARGYLETYRYDALGNFAELRHSAGPGGSFTRRFLPAAAPAVAADNRLAAMRHGPETIDYAHNAAGQLVSEDLSRNYHWDHAGQLKAFAVTSGSGPASVTALYLYGADGARVKKLVQRQSGQTRSVTTAGGIERTREAGISSDVLDMADGASRIASFRFGPPLPGDTTPARKFILTDHLGSANVVLDELGAFVDREEFLPYGQTSFGSYARKRWRFTGQYRDEESGLQRHGARYYSFWSGRWLTPDPAGPVDGLSLYVYSRSSPICVIDDTGLNGRKPSSKRAETAPKNQKIGAEVEDKMEEAFEATGSKAKSRHTTLNTGDSTVLSDRDWDWGSVDSKSVDASAKSYRRKDGDPKMGQVGSRGRKEARKAELQDKGWKDTGKSVSLKSGGKRSYKSLFLFVVDGANSEEFKKIADKLIAEAKKTYPQGRFAVVTPGKLDDMKRLARRRALKAGLKIGPIGVGMAVLFASKEAFAGNYSGAAQEIVEGINPVQEPFDFARTAMAVNEYNQAVGVDERMVDTGQAVQDTLQSALEGVPGGETAAAIGGGYTTAASAWYHAPKALIELEIEIVQDVGGSAYDLAVDAWNYFD